MGGFNKFELEILQKEKNMRDVVPRSHRRRRHHGETGRAEGNADAC